MVGAALAPQKSGRGEQRPCYNLLAASRAAVTTGSQTGEKGGA